FAEARIPARDAFAAAGAERLTEALWDMDRLHPELSGRGLHASMPEPRVGAALGGAGAARLERLMRPLTREAHCLRRWDPIREPGFFLQQLRNRCSDLGLEDLERRLDTALEPRRWPCLRERFRTSRESEALVCTLEGHADRVRGV